MKGGPNPGWMGGGGISCLLFPPYCDPQILLWKINNVL